jgi:archaemetzincin
MRREARTATLLPELRDLPSPKPIAEIVRQQCEPMKRLALLLLLLFADCKRAVPPGRVVLVPIGPLPANVLADLQRELAPILKREVTIGDEIPRPPAGFNKSRNQYLGDALLEQLERNDRPDAARVVGIIDSDAYAPGLNYVFGQARLPGRFAVVALPRLRQSLRAHPEDAARFRERVLKITIHELGHTFGFVHCPDRKCVMHFSNAIGEADYSGVQYCDNERG